MTIFLLLLIPLTHVASTQTPACTYDVQKVLITNKCLPVGYCEAAKIDAENLKCRKGYQLEYKSTRDNMAVWVHDTEWFPCISVKSTDAVRCRKRETNCDLNAYFDHRECEFKYDCTVPSLNTEDYVECKNGILQAFLFDNWIEMNVIKPECFRKRGITFDPESALKNIFPQLLRCRNDAKKCSASVAELTEKCADGDCDTIEVVDFSIKCKTGYYLEGLESTDKTWHYVTDASNSLKCHGKVVNPDYPAKYSKYRCMKQRGCDVLPLFETSLCDRSQICKAPSTSSRDYKCPDGFGIEFINEGDSEKKWTKSHHLECESDRLRAYLTAADKSDAIPHKIRCMKEKACDLEHFISKSVEQCDPNSECEKPIKNNSTDNVITCNSDYGLQGMLKNQAWIDVFNVTCVKNKFDVKTTEGAAVDEFIADYRCTRKKIHDFYVESDCKEDEVCTEPENCTSLSCSPNDLAWALQLKSANTDWQIVKSARCDSTAFKAILSDGNTLDQASPKVRCMGHKCTRCDHPCPTCPPNSTAKVIKSSQWNVCSKFTCGEHSRLVIGDEKSENTEIKCDYSKSNRNASWTLNNTFFDTVKCDYYCTLKSPINSTCNARDTTCDTRDLIDDKPISCNKEMFYKVENKEATKIENIRCNLTDGMWIAKIFDSATEEIVPAGSNVYCLEGHCEESRIFPPCKGDDEDCKDYRFSGNKYVCMDPATFWYRDRESEEWTFLGAVDIECRAATIVVNGTRKPYEYQLNCRTPSNPSAARGGMGVGAYVGMALVMMILIVIVIATIIIRVTGGGWLPMIIIRRIRGDKGKEGKDSRDPSASSMASSKSTTQPTPTTPLPATPKKPRARKSSNTVKTARSISSTNSDANSTPNSTPNSTLKETVFII